MRWRLVPDQGTPLEPAAHTPGSHQVEAFWERTEALLERGVQDTTADQDMLDSQEDAAPARAPSKEQAALCAAQARAIAAAGRLVGAQVGCSPRRQAVVYRWWGLTAASAFATGPAASVGKPSVEPRTCLCRGTFSWQCVYLFRQGTSLMAQLQRNM